MAGEFSTPGGPEEYLDRITRRSVREEPGKHGFAETLWRYPADPEPVDDVVCVHERIVHPLVGENRRVRRGGSRSDHNRRRWATKDGGLQYPGCVTNQDPQTSGPIDLVQTSFLLVVRG